MKIPRTPWWIRFAAALATLVALLGLGGSAMAFTPPPLRGHVVDTAGKLSQRDVLDLDAKLDAYRRQSGNAIVVFVVGSLDGEPIEDVAYTTFNAWKVGEKGKDNGVLLVIAPNERKTRIETGKGVGGALTDLQSNDILREVVAPLLQQDRFRDAIDAGTTAIAKALGGEAPMKPGVARRAPPPRQQPTGIPIPALIVLGAVVLLAIVSRTFREILWWIVTAMLFRGGGGGGGSWGGGGSGGSGYSGGGGESGGGGSSDDY